jgi:hypothetical protein
MEIDGRADIYSLGLVFYEMIWGRRCYSAATLQGLRKEHITTTPRPLFEVMPDVPRGFSDAIERATAKDRDDRQATASQLAAELRAGLGGSDGSSTHPGRGASSRAGSLADTVTVSTTLETNSDVNAATILTLDPSVTAAPVEHITTTPSAPVNGEQAQPRPVSNPAGAMSAATMVESADMASSLTIDQSPRGQVGQAARAEVTAPPSKGKSLGLIAVAVGVILLVVVGAGGFLVFNWVRAKPNNPAVISPRTSAVTSVPQEVGRYWLELEKPSTRVAGLVPIASGQSLKLHFAFSESGYLYIVGPGDKNQATAFLTAKPAAMSGLESNRISQSGDLSFPNGRENWLTLDSKPGTESYTVIFSKTPLSTPAFLNGPVNLQPLSQKDQTEFADFVARYKSNPPIAELDESNGSAPFMRLKALASEVGNPIVFEVRVQHK